MPLYSLTDHDYCLPLPLFLHKWIVEFSFSVPHHRQLFNQENMPSQAKVHQTQSRRNAGPSFSGQKHIENLPRESRSSGRPQVSTKSRQNSFDFVADMAARGPAENTPSKSTRAAQLSWAAPRPPAKVALSEHSRCSVGFAGSEICPGKTRVKEPEPVRAGVIELHNLPVFLCQSAGELSVPPTARLAGR